MYVCVCVCVCVCMYTPSVSPKGDKKKGEGKGGGGEYQRAEHIPMTSSKDIYQRMGGGVPSTLWGRHCIFLYTLTRCTSIAQLTWCLLQVEEETRRARKPKLFWRCVSLYLRSIHVHRHTCYTCMDILECDQMVLYIMYKCTVQNGPTSYSQPLM